MAGDDPEDREEIHLRSSAGGLLCQRPIAGGMVLFDTVEQVGEAGFGLLEVCSECRAVLSAYANRRN